MTESVGGIGKLEYPNDQVQRVFLIERISKGSSSGEFRVTCPAHARHIVCIRNNDGKQQWRAHCIVHRVRQRKYAIATRAERAPIACSCMFLSPQNHRKGKPSHAVSAIRAEDLETQQL